MAGFGRVKGRFVTFVVDSADPDENPDQVALGGTVSFRLNVTKVLQAGASPVPLVIASTPFVAVIDSQGYLCTPDATGVAPQYRDINLVANDDADLNPVGTLYNVEYALRLGNTPVTIPSHTIFVPEGGIVDLANFIIPDNSPPVGTAQAEALLALAVRSINGVGPDEDGDVVVAGGGGGGGTWGSITGTLSAQMDLNSVLVGLQAGVDAKAADTVVVKLTGAQTIAGIKTFSSAPVVPDASFSIAKTSSLQAALDAKAPLVSPALTGNPTVPTQVTSDDSTKAASTAFVKAAIAALIAGSPVLLDTLDEIAAALGDDPNFAATMTTALGLKAPLASPAFTGNPTAPTPATSDNDTSIATTAMVQLASAAKVNEKVEVVTQTAWAAGPKTAGKLYVISGA